jgi:hypothetical protein
MLVNTQNLTHAIINTNGYAERLIKKLGYTRT